MITGSNKKCAVCGKQISRSAKKYCFEHRPVRRGHKLTDEHKRKIGLGNASNKNRKKTIHDKQFKKGHKVGLGKKKSLESRQRMREAYSKINGESRKTPANELIRKSVEYKEWRRGVFERDNYTCQKCGQRGGRLNAHHKKQVSYNPDLAYDLSNGETLCEPCHKKIFVKRPKGKIGKDVFTHTDERRTIYDWYNGEYGVVKSNKVVFVEDTIPIGDHYHKNKDEIFFLASGEFLEVVLNDKITYNIPAPYKIIVPRGTYHKFVCSPGSILVGGATEEFDPKDEIK